MALKSSDRKSTRRSAIRFTYKNTELPQEIKDLHRHHFITNFDTILDEEEQEEMRKRQKSMVYDHYNRMSVSTYNLFKGRRSSIQISARHKANQTIQIN